MMYVRDPITKMYPFYKSNGTRELLCVSENKLHTEADGTLTVKTGALSSNEAKMLTYKTRTIQDVVLVADGGNLKAYDGTNVTNVIAHIPSTDEQTNPGLNELNGLSAFRTFAMKKDRIFAAAHPTLKNRVSFSYFDPYLGYAVYDYFPSTYFFDVAVEDNDEIVELKVFRNVLVIFCKRSVWVLKGDGATLVDYELIKLNTPKGCISPGSVQEVGNNLFYLADDHVYSLFATEQDFISAQVMSANIEPLLKSNGSADKTKATSVFYGNKYYLSFPSGVVLVYDAMIEAWTQFTNIPATSFIVLDGELYFSAKDGFIYRFDSNVYSDDGQAIEFSVKTKTIDFEMPVNKKKIRRLWVMTKKSSGYTSTYDLFGLLDQFSLISLNDQGTNAGSGGIWDESNWDEAVWDFGDVSQDEIKMRRKTKSIQLQITNDKVDEPLTVFGFVFEYQLKKP